MLVSLLSLEGGTRLLLTSDHRERLLGLDCEAAVEGGAVEFRFGLRSDPRTKVFVPSEQIRTPAHCSVRVSAHIVGAR